MSTTREFSQLQNDVDNEARNQIIDKIRDLFESMMIQSPYGGTDITERSKYDDNQRKKFTSRIRSANKQKLDENFKKNNGSHRCELSGKKTNNPHSDHEPALKQSYDRTAKFLTDEQKAEMGADPRLLGVVDGKINMSKGSKKVDNFEHPEVSNKNKLKYKNKPERIAATKEWDRKGCLQLGKDTLADSQKAGLHNVACRMYSTVVFEMATHLKRNPKFKLQALKIVMIKSGKRFKNEWKEYAKTFFEGTFSRFVKIVVNLLLAQFKRLKKTFNVIVKLGKSQFIELKNAFLLILNPPKGISKGELFESFSEVIIKVSAVFSGVLVGEALANYLAGMGIPLSEYLAPIVGLIVGAAIALLLLVFINKCDFFGLNKARRRELLAKKVDEKVNQDYACVDAIFERCKAKALKA